MIQVNEREILETIIVRASTSLEADIRVLAQQEAVNDFMTFQLSIGERFGLQRRVVAPKPRATWLEPLGIDLPSPSAERREFFAYVGFICIPSEFERDEQIEPFIERAVDKIVRGFEKANGIG